VIEIYHSYLSPYARRVLIVLAEKELQHERQKYEFARELEGLSTINPCLLLPVYIDDAVHLWGSNLIVEYLLKTYPGSPAGSPQPPLAATMTRPEHHWEDARILATLETMTDSMMNLRQMKMSGLEPNDVCLSAATAEADRSLPRLAGKDRHSRGFCSRRVLDYGSQPGVRPRQCGQS